MTTPTFERPQARTLRFVSAAAAVPSSARDMLELWSLRTRTRAALEMLSVDRLEDLGLTRADILRETRKPFWRA